MLTGWRRLRETGTLGINSRNLDFVAKHNPRKLFPLVDDKLRTKALALEMGLAVPALYGVIEHQHEIRELPQLLADHEDFVVKPAQGSGGNGVLVVAGRRRERLVLASGDSADFDELSFHVSKILSGLFSLGGERDKAMIEYRVRFDPLFEGIAYRGVPDVRIVVFHGVPAMAMVRLPTRASEGRANLHQGAIGVGIDLTTGQTLGGVWGNDTIDEHPDTGAPIAGLVLPNWTTMLEIAAQCRDLTGLGYLGVDLVLDGDRGPLVLELNARPGLAIQLANRRGLRHRLTTIEGNAITQASVEERVAFARDRFAHR